MKIVKVETLIDSGDFARSVERERLHDDVLQAIGKIVWPPGSDKFTIRPQKKGNGVPSIRKQLTANLVREELKNSWEKELKIKLATSRSSPGALDAVVKTGYGNVAVEWETGNISSSHRAMNKMALHLMRGKLISGTLILPTRELYKYLTDRVGNWEELEPYADLWKALPIRNGILEVVVVSFDELSDDVPLIPKGTDGRALR
ncbi:MAG: Restriction endonuclease BamHI [Schlesneria sp.]|nr:Restriction endonuclease BamHI [Schlesneria sp.]